MASIAMRVAVSATSTLEADHLPLKLQNSQQFIAAALLGRGVPSFESMTALRIPVVIDEEQAGVPDNALTPWRRVLRDDVMFERADTALRRAFKRAGQPLPDSVTFQFQKLSAITTVMSHIRRYGLFVYTQQLLFAPEFEETGMAILKEMKLPELPPVSASSAIAHGELPALPSRNTKDHLLFLNRSRLFIRGFGNGSLADWVAKMEPTLIEFPAPNIRVGRLARHDQYSEHMGKQNAQIGLGFILATKKEQVGQRISFLTPTFNYYRPKGAPAQLWRPEVMDDQVNLKIVSSNERNRLERALSDIGGRAARLKVCPSCSEIYSDDRANLNLRCACMQTNEGGKNGK